MRLCLYRASVDQHLDTFGCARLSLTRRQSNYCFSTEADSNETLGSVTSLATISRCLPGRPAKVILFCELHFPPKRASAPGERPSRCTASLGPGCHLSRQTVLPCAAAVGSDRTVAHVCSSVDGASVHSRGGGETATAILECCRTDLWFLDQCKLPLCLLSHSV